MHWPQQHVFCDSSSLDHTHNRYYLDQDVKDEILEAWITSFSLTYLRWIFKQHTPSWSLILHGFHSVSIPVGSSTMRSIVFSFGWSQWTMCRNMYMQAELTYRRKKSVENSQTRNMTSLCPLTRNSIPYNILSSSW